MGDWKKQTSSTWACTQKMVELFFSILSLFKLYIFHSELYTWI